MMRFIYFYLFLDKKGWCPGFIETTPRVLQHYREKNRFSWLPSTYPQPQTSSGLITAGGKNEQLNRSYPNKSNQHLPQGRTKLLLKELQDHLPASGCLRPRIV
jgi:hypothetical protein